MLWKKLDLNLKKTIGFNQTKSYYWNYKEFGKLFYKGIISNAFIVAAALQQIHKFGLR
ncbi:MAG: hypothetical protein SCALA701_24280 [Candidatus Scalindua sp.]|nr:hypothetical protein [Planctomycetota bacterium]GJQ59627.1 MAG: hypothetical protein SCALA701_24280 [Candidatus Scalindua sp.]